MAYKSKLRLADLWHCDDPRDVPIYTIPEAAHYLYMPRATLAAWVRGQPGFKRVIDLPHSEENLLSFYNLAEAHVLRALRTKHAVPLPAIRRAIDYVRKELGWKRPVIQQGFKRDGVRLFVEKLGTLVDASGGGQLVMQELMLHLARLEWKDELAARLYPFTRNDLDRAPKSVLIDPQYSFGRPILTAARVATAVVAQRYKAGESVQSLADDYGCSQLEIEEGIRCELRLRAAA